MNDDFLNMLRRRYAFDEWLDPEPRDENVFIWAFRPFSVLGLKPEGVQVFDSPAASTDLVIPTAQLRPIPTTDWIYCDGLSVFVMAAFELDSRAAARAHLLRFLAGFEGPEVTRSEIAGEISFAPNDWSGVLVRGNMVIYASNGTTELNSVRPLLTEIDQRLEGQLALDILDDLPIAPPSLTGDIPLNLPTPGLREWVQIRARGGEVKRVEEELRFVPAVDTGRSLSIARFSLVAGTRFEI
ncbi:MAG TPA: hypothetical protein VG323_07065 [Thermoanaerobaculia bacterium]|nr:hypothetical protein [Thermoanaerobaculia bacterium]